MTFINVNSLDAALDEYWRANTPREHQAAYHEIKLFGGRDGFARKGWRTPVVRWLRQLACWLERG